jgi:hypothetical protein
MNRTTLALCLTGLLSRAIPPAHSQEAPICADRPTKSNNACTAEPGTWQLETDLFNGSFQRSGRITTDTYLVTNPTLKYGIAPALDLEANMVPYEIMRMHDASGTHTLSGIGDLFLRAKYEPLADGPVQFAAIPYVKLPTARDGIGNGAVEAGASMPVNITLSDAWSLGFSPEFDALKDASGEGRHFNTSQTMEVGYALPADLTLNAEVWGDWNADPAGTSPQYSLDFAAAKLLTKTFQIDGGVNIGLNRATPDLQLYAGLATRF